MSARSCNAYRGALVAFCNWCVDTQRLLVNPFEGLPKFNEMADPRRKRRALTEDELLRLLDAARERPLRDAMTIRRGPKKGQATANLRPETRERLLRLGKERALIYKTLFLTGLRRGELASLTIGQLEFEGPIPRALLKAADEKNRQGSEIPLRDDLAEDLKAWIAEMLKANQEEAIRKGNPVPSRIDMNAPLFTIPRVLGNIFNLDLKAAGIPKRDNRGYTVDVHALRTSFGTHLSKAGVPLRTAQAALRHSDPKLTANVYTDPRLLDVSGALDALPKLPLQPEDDAPIQEAAAACGNGSPPTQGLAPMLAPTLGDCCPSVADPDTSEGSGGRPCGRPSTARRWRGRW